MNKRIIEELYPEIRKMAFLFADTKPDADDLAHDVVEKALTKAPKLHGLGWIFQVMKRKSISDFRKRKRERNFIEYEVDLTYMACNEDLARYFVNSAKANDDNLDPELKDAVRSLKNVLNEAQWVVLNLIAEGASYEEVAQTTGAAIGTVRSRLHFARMKSREFLKPIMNSMQK